MSAGDFVTFRCHYCDTKFSVGKYWVMNNPIIKCDKPGCSSVMTEANLVNTAADEEKRDVFGYNSDAPKEDAYIRRR